MSESYPHHLETGLGLDDASAAELQRIVARLKQEQAQLAADQRQIKQQRLRQEQIGNELDSRRRELDRSLRALQTERKALLEQSATADRELQAEHSRLQALQQSLGAYNGDLHERERQVRERQEHLAAEASRLESLQADLDTRQVALQVQQQAAVEYRASLDRQAADLQARSASLTQQELAAQDLTGAREHLQQQAAELARSQQLLSQQEAALRDRGITLDAQQEDLRRQTQHLQAERHELSQQTQQFTEQQRALDAQRQALTQQQNSLNRLQADLLARESSLRNREGDVSGLQHKVDEAAGKQQELAGLQASLQQKQQELAALQATLTDKQRCLEKLEVDLRRRSRSQPVAGTAEQAAQLADMQKEISQQDAQAKLATEQLAVLNKRLEGVQAELVVLREQKQRLTGERDASRQEQAALQDRCQALQRRVEELAAVEPARTHEQAVAAVPAPADPLAMIAAHAAKTRRQARAQQSSLATGRAKLRIPLVVASLAGVLAAVAMLAMSPAEYWLSARVVLPAGSPLAERPELTRAQHELAGRLVEPNVLGGQISPDRVSVAADFDRKGVVLQVLSASPSRVSENLKDLLQRYRKDLQGGMLVAAQTQLAADLARQINACQVQMKDLAARKADLQAKVRALEPQEKAYGEAVAVVEKARKDLDELRSRSDKVSAGLRVLQRTPPSSKAEIPPDRLETEAARDSQLVAVRGQVAVRGAELREMLAQLVQKASDKCNQMDSYLAKFVSFLDSQSKQIPDEALQGEIKQIAMPSSNLRKIVQDSRQQLDDLSAAIAKAEEVTQARQLVSLHAQSEKSLESLINQAADANKQIDALLEKIPAGGEDVTRRTVLQERLQAQFALVQKTHQEMAETLNGLRPSVNFRLDAALSGVEGLARQLDQRQKGLLEQIQQQDARQLRAKYDKQVQDARAELDDYNIQRDRVLVLLTTGSDNMLQADAGRSRSLELRGQIADLDRQASELNDALAGARKRSDNLQATTSQPAAIVIEGPVVQASAANGRSRLFSAALAAIAVFGVVLAAGTVGVQRLASVQSGRP